MRKFGLIAAIIGLLTLGSWVLLRTAAHSENWLWLPGIVLLTGGSAIIVWCRFAASAATPVPRIPERVNETLRMLDNFEQRFAELKGRKPTTALFAELYALGNQLEQRGKNIQATAVYRHLARLDNGYRDVGARLKRLMDVERASAARSETATLKMPPRSAQMAAAAGRAAGPAAGAVAGTAAGTAPNPAAAGRPAFAAPGAAATAWAAPARGSARPDTAAASPDLGGPRARGAPSDSPRAAPPPSGEARAGPSRGGPVPGAPPQRSPAAGSPLPGEPLPAGVGPEQLGRYRLERVIGRGAMGTVYLGRDTAINRLVAIKAIPLAAEFSETELAEARARFFREAETAGRLNHPNIVTIYDVGEERGLAYIAMEYLKGRHLSDYAKAKSLLDARKVLEIVARTADALGFAHKQQVVHRDIKPANLMYDPATEVLKITDFGIARLTDSTHTRTGIVLGTPSFMSPEQLEGRIVTGSSDLFSLGVSLFQLLTGQLPFTADSMTGLMQQIAEAPHPRLRAFRPDLPVCVESVIDRALAKSPDGRYETGAQMAAALEDCKTQMSSGQP